jgi:hypothetical protein
MIFGSTIKKFILVVFLIIMTRLCFSQIEVILDPYEYLDYDEPQLYEIDQYSHQKLDMVVICPENHDDCTKTLKQISQEKEMAQYNWTISDFEQSQWRSLRRPYRPVGISSQQQRCSY